MPGALHQPEMASRTGCRGASCNGYTTAGRKLEAALADVGWHVGRQVESLRMKTTRTWINASRRKMPWHLTWPFLVASLIVVHDAALGGRHRALAQEKNQAAPKAQTEVLVAPRTTIAGQTLPLPVAEMREAILAAVTSGSIEDLREAFELNELKPDLGPGFGGQGEYDPVVFWRKLSSDGEGREILTALGKILELPAAVLPLGPDVENSNVYIWPYLAELPLRTLSPEQRVDLSKLVSLEDAAAMAAADEYRFWRLAISADGVWLSFTRK